MQSCRGSDRVTTQFEEQFLYTLWCNLDTPSVLYSGFIGCFGSCNSPGDTARVIKSRLVSKQLWWSTDLLAWFTAILTAFPWRWDLHQICRGPLLSIRPSMMLEECCGGFARRVCVFFSFHCCLKMLCHSSIVQQCTIAALFLFVLHLLSTVRTCILKTINMTTNDFLNFLCSVRAARKRKTSKI